MFFRKKLYTLHRNSIFLVPTNIFLVRQGGKRLCFQFFSAMIRYIKEEFSSVFRVIFCKSYQKIKRCARFFVPKR